MTSAASTADSSSTATNLKEQLNQDTKSEERGETPENSSNVFQQLRNIPTAGRPSEPPPHHQPPTTASSPAARVGGRRSRRNSVDENTSQLSLENLGGSQDNLHMLGRNPDKEMKTHVGRRIQLIDNRELEEMEDEGNGKQQQFVNLNKDGSSPGGGGGKVSFADLRRQKARDHFHSSGINITYNDDEEEKADQPKATRRTSSSNISRASHEPVTSTAQEETPSSSSSAVSPDAMASQLNNVRMKLEQRRKRIEEEKKKMENIMARQREKVGHEAFLRAVGVKSTTTNISPSSVLIILT